MDIDTTSEDYAKVITIVPQIERIRRFTNLEVTDCQLDDESGSFTMCGEINQWEIPFVQRTLFESPHIYSVQGEDYHDDTSMGWVCIEGSSTRAY